ncbi:DsbA family oxidoreductase [Ramlibacter rhizophilus]|uniref:DsbA family oxidoreductase n=1 Tax=Ramlibacter rhizophilus TaxID=1781167 RepID=A0A4Z0BKZ1_9BURK|nr:DsbA family oxidoreductase [Ramlibacter rhizophilus]TFY98764.1 DsbA family oxidoreductase [Ramlibacter rhizophilus]
MQRLTIDFVSDVVCPWCAVGLGSLEAALRRLEGEVEAEVRFQPFQLNPDMPPEGEDITEHLARKYGSTPEQQSAAWRSLRERAAAVGFDFREQGRGRTWNTFDAHRLLHWAGELSLQAQRSLKRGLLEAYFGQGENPSDPAVLLREAERAGLDAARAAEVLANGEFADEVRRQQAFYAAHGIRAVPSVIVNGRHLLQGGQPPEVFEAALRQIAAAPT